MLRYMTTVREVEDGPIHLVPMEWVRGLHKSGLLSLMHMPHFGRTTEVNVCVKQLLVCFHEGCLWLDRQILVDVDLIATITRIPLVGVSPMHFFTRKE